MVNTTMRDALKESLKTVDRIESEAGITNAGVPPAFQYKPIDIGVDLPDNTTDFTTKEIVNGKYNPIKNGEPYATEEKEVAPVIRDGVPASEFTKGNDAWDEDVWGAALNSGGKYIKIADGETRVLKFMSNDPIATINKFERKAWEFDVTDESGEQKIFSVTNISLIKVLYAMLPLLYKNYAVTRTGVGSVTTYRVKPVRTDAF